MAFTKTNPPASTSLRSSNPLILANNAALETALDAEHNFATDSTQDGLHTQGSARCFFQDSAPTTRIDGDSFTAADYGSMWIDSNSDPDNQFNILTNHSPVTWTPVSTEIIAVLLASARVFAGTLGVTGDFAVNTDKFTVAATTGNTLVAGTLDVTGNIDPTTFETTNGGFLDEDNMASNAANKAASQQSIKAYTDASVGDSYRLVSVNGASVKVYTKYLTGTLAAATPIYVAHGITNALTKILCVVGTAYNDNTARFRVAEMSLGATLDEAFTINWDATNIIFGLVGDHIQGNAYRIRIDYIL